MLKGKRLLTILLATSLLFSFTVDAQTVDDHPQEQDSVHWQANAILNHFAAVLMTNGGYFGSGNPLGVQMKRVKGNDALRWHLEYRPSASTLWDNSNVGQIRSRSGDTLRMVVDDYRGHQFRLGMGFERGKSGKLGRGYVGSDLSLAYRYTRHWLFEYYYHIDEGRVDREPREGRLETNPTRHLSAFGVGFKPFIGLERPLTQHWGLNLEAKLDFMFQYSEGYEIMDDATFRALAPVAYFETYPLLEVRLYYNF